jgi:excisionase family DNA binding protein
VDDVFTIDDLALYLNIPKSTVYRLVQAGKIPGRKIGRHWRFTRDAIDAWLSVPSHHVGKENVASSL